NGILVIDVETRLITTANPTAVAMIGAEQDDIIGSVCHDFICTRQQGACPIMDLGESIDNRETILVRADGGHTAILKTVAPIMLEGRECLLETFIDITDRKQAEVEKEKLEVQLHQAQKMESVGRLAGGVAHDFNNMLGVILGHTEMALEEIDPSTPLYSRLHAIQYAAERSADLTRQMLAFARKQTVAPKVIDINNTVEGMLKMLRRLIGEDIDLLWQPGQSLQLVKVDPSQIDQILANLCVNARDAIAGEGKITIETDTKIFDEAYCADHLGSLPGEYVLLQVSDNGCGMDKKILNQIFEPFFTTKEQGKGTGLGLASVFGMIKQNNGFINVYSEPNQGTTFKIYLPAYAVKSEGVVEKATDIRVEPGNETILLVEDEPAILQMTTMMLTRLGYTVIAAATPGEAILLAHEHRGGIDLLMTDVVMPEMNGRELAGSLRSHYPDLKRLFMSGYTANVIAHHGVLDEGVHFIQKPFSMKDLGGKLREVLEG
ncbi:MAG: response regulator, partial [Desulfofustis sp.]|nr:response regulator [Desulfofustis sp.]